MTLDVVVIMMTAVETYVKYQQLYEYDEVLIKWFGLLRIEPDNEFYDGEKDNDKDEESEFNTSSNTTKN